MLEDPTLAATDASVSTPSGADSLVLRRGETIGRFVIIDELGRGAMGTVYAVFDVKLERQVALKLLHRSDRGMGSLLAEAQALARVNHPNVVTVFDVGDHQGRLYLAMELVQGRTLREWQADTSPDWRELLAVYRGAARGLQAVHEADLVHGDFKPDNVMVADDGRVLVMDFGIARSLEDTSSHEELTASHSGSRSLDVSRIRGTPAYMAPEQLHLDGVGPASDQFAFCVALYEALWGERPFDGETLAELASNVAQGDRRKRPSGRSVPQWLTQVVERGLSKKPEDRFESMAALDESFDQSLRRRMQAFSLAGAIGLTAAIGTALALTPPEQSPCEVAAKQFDARVSGDDIASLRQRILDIEHDDAPSSAQRFDRRLDAFAEQWHEANAALCRPSTENPALLTARRQCLQRQVEHLGVLVDVYGDAPTLDLSRVGNLASALPRPSQCATLDNPSAIEGTSALALIEAQQALARARALATTGRVDEGLALVDAQLETIRSLDAPALEANLYLWRAAKLRTKGQYDEALANTKAAQYAATRASDEDLPCLGWLDRAYHTQRVTPNATALIESQLEAAEFELLRVGNPPNLRIRYLMRKANTELRTGKADAAIADLTEALALTEQAPPRQLTISNIHNLRAMAHINAGHEPQAHADFRAAHDVLEGAYGPHHPVLSQSRSNLGTICMSRGDFECARQTFEEALRTLEASSSDNPTSKAWLLTNLAEVAYWQGDASASRRHAEDALAVATQAGFADTPESVPARVKLLRVLGEQEAWAQGEAVLEDLLRVNEAVFDGMIDAVGPYLEAAKWSTAKGDYDAALAYAVKARGAAEEHAKTHAGKLAETLAAEASALIVLERLDDADAALTRAQAIVDADASSPVLSLSVGFSRAKLLEAAGRHDDAASTATALVLAADPDDVGQAKARARLVSWMKSHDMPPPPQTARAVEPAQAGAAKARVSPG
ncbi:MAG: protein kinase domain-containing protein [Nannocystaceae bacterium]|nr:protein kinase [bacterium]